MTLSQLAHHTEQMEAARRDFEAAWREQFLVRIRQRH